MISRARKRGFTLLEVVIVVAIFMVISAMAMPKILAAISLYRLRSSASGVAALFQKTRMQAVGDDRWYPVAKASTASGQDYLWGDMWGDPDNTPPNGTLDSGKKESQVVVSLPRGITVQFTDPGDITSKLDFSPTHDLPAFNARGLPCTRSGGVCMPQTGGAITGEGSGFVCYLRQERSLGTPNWAAVTVSPAGRAKVWMWDGTDWK